MPTRSLTQDEMNVLTKELLAAFEDHDRADRILALAKAEHKEQVALAKETVARVRDSLRAGTVEIPAQKDLFTDIEAVEIQQKLDLEVPPLPDIAPHVNYASTADGALIEKPTETNDELPLLPEEVVQ